MTHDHRRGLHRIFHNVFPTIVFFLAGFYLVTGPEAPSWAQEAKGPPPVPVAVAAVEKRTVSRQISLIGSTAALRSATVAAEVPGIVESFPVKAGDFVQQGTLLASLRETEARLRLKGALAARDRVKANLDNAQKELERFTQLKEADSIALSRYDAARFIFIALENAFQEALAEIDRLEYEILRKKVYAPFSGFISKEHTQVGEWIGTGGSVVALVDLSSVLVTVDVPERHAAALEAESAILLQVRSISPESFPGTLYAVMPEGNSAARTVAIQVRMDNPGMKIKAGMEALVTFSLAETHEALLVPKDAVVTAGASRLVFVEADGKAVPVPVEVAGYYGGEVAVSGQLIPGARVVTRGNERLQPGQPIQVLP